MTAVVDVAEESDEHPGPAIPLYEYVVERLKAQGIPVGTGRFGADMQVELVNDGPVTMLVEVAGEKPVDLKRA